MFRWLLVFPSRPSRKTLWNLTHNKAFLTCSKFSFTDFSAGSFSCIVSRKTHQFPLRSLLLIDWTPERSWRVCILCSSDMHPITVDVHESARGSRASAHTSFKYNGPWRCLLHSVKRVCQTAEYKVEKNITLTFYCGGTLSKALLFVCSAGRRDEESKHVNPRTNISSCLIYISVSPSLVLFSNVPLMFSLSESNFTSAKAPILQCKIFFFFTCKLSWFHNSNKLKVQNQKNVLHQK